MSASKFKCPYCPARMDRDKYEEHRVYCEMSKPHVCHLCTDKRFATEKALESHKSSYHTAEERQTKYKCRYCEHGSDDKNAMLKHQKKHIEEGGPGFRARSRSRAPASASDTTVTVQSSESNQNAEVFVIEKKIQRVNRSRSRTFRATPTTTDDSRIGTRSRAAAPSDREPIQATPVFPSQNAGPRGQIQQGTGTSDMQMDVTEENEQAMDQQKLVLPLTKTGLIKLALVDPEYARQKMRQQNEKYDAVNREIREMNQELRQMCRDMNFTLREEDIIEQQLQAYEARFGKL